MTIKKEKIEVVKLSQCPASVGILVDELDGDYVWGTNCKSLVHVERLAGHMAQYGSSLADISKDEAKSAVRFLLELGKNCYVDLEN